MVLGLLYVGRTDNLTMATITWSYIEARCCHRRAAHKLHKNNALPLVGLAGSKQDPIKNREKIDG